MKTKSALIALVIIALGAGVWALVGGKKSDPQQLVPAWQLLDKGRYRALGVTDPIVTWSPNSKSLLFSLQGFKSQKDTIYLWQVGAKSLEQVTDGASPNYVDDTSFLYLRKTPTTAVMLRDLSTGKEKEVMPAIKSSNLWGEVLAFTYLPERRGIAVRLTDFTQYYNAGTQEFDAAGKLVGPVSDLTSEGVVESSPEIGGDGRALLVEEKEGQPLQLQIAKGDATRGQTVDSGFLGCVAWSPNGKTIAYGRASEVVAVRPSDHRRVVIGRFGDPDSEKDKQTVMRLSWSPNSDFLLAMVYCPQDSGDYPLYYVMDMSKFAWD